MHRFYSIAREIVAISLISSFGSVLHADLAPYSEIFECKSESNRLLAQHRHDWSVATQDARWRMTRNHQSQFSPSNTFSFLEVTDKSTNARLFKSPVPALRYLWVSQDSRFIVGLSNIQLFNQIQVVVFNPRGKRLFAKKVEWSSFPGVTVSATNWVHWYKEPSPQISITESKGWVNLQIEGQNGEQRIFKFHSTK